MNLNLMSLLPQPSAMPIIPSNAGQQIATFELPAILPGATELAATPAAARLVSQQQPQAFATASIAAQVAAPLQQFVRPMMPRAATEISSPSGLTQAETVESLEPSEAAKELASPALPVPSLPPVQPANVPPVLVIASVAPQAATNIQQRAATSISSPSGLIQTGTAESPQLGEVIEQLATPQLPAPSLQPVHRANMPHVATAVVAAPAEPNIDRADPAPAAPLLGLSDQQQPAQIVIPNDAYSATINGPADTAVLPKTGDLDLVNDALWFDRLAREIVAVAATDGRLKFTLSPEMLGDLDIAISTQPDGVSIQLQTSTESAARIIAAEQPRLAEELRMSGVKLVNSDLMGGGPMTSARDQSQPQTPARQAAAQNQAASPDQPRPHRALPSANSGRFA